MEKRIPDPGCFGFYPFGLLIVFARETKAFLDQRIAFLSTLSEERAAEPVEKDKGKKEQAKPGGQMGLVFNETVPTEIRAIGLSNFPPDRVMDMIVHHRVAPAVNQIETHKFLQENGVQIESRGPFGKGKNNIFQNELLVSLAGKYQKTVAQIILCWLTQRGVVANSQIRSRGAN